MMESYKEDFRKRCKLVNESIQAMDRDFHSESICQRLLELSCFKRAVTVMAFMPMKTEPDISSVIEYALGFGKVVCVPVCVPSRQLLTVAPVDWDRMEKTKFGVSEPREDNYILIDPDSIDVAIIPGVAFDTQCNRLGNGYGYYDRFLAKCGTDMVKIGVCFESQLHKSVPNDDIDIPMDWVITEATGYEMPAVF